jgi:hypothetical protein
MECLPSQHPVMNMMISSTFHTKKKHRAEQAHQANLNVLEDVPCKKSVPQTLKPQQKKVRTHTLSMLHLPAQLL